MSKSITVDVIDVGGRFGRLFASAPREIRANLADAVKKTVFSMAQRMKVDAPVGPDAPHIKDAIDAKSRGVFGTAGIHQDQGLRPARAGSDTTLAEVALYNEYDPNQQPFEGGAAQAETNDFRVRATRALQMAERSLSGGVGI